jgi:hypothetical protein
MVGVASNVPPGPVIKGGRKSRMSRSQKRRPQKRRPQKRRSQKRRSQKRRSQKGGDLSEEKKNAVIRKRIEELMLDTGVELPEEQNSQEHSKVVEEFNELYTSEYETQDNKVLDKITDTLGELYLEDKISWEDLETILEKHTDIKLAGQNIKLLYHFYSTGQGVTIETIQKFIKGEIDFQEAVN